MSLSLSFTRLEGQGLPVVGWMHCMKCGRLGLGLLGMWHQYLDVLVTMLVLALPPSGHWTGVLPRVQVASPRYA